MYQLNTLLFFCVHISAFFCFFIMRKEHSQSASQRKKGDPWSCSGVAPIVSYVVCQSGFADESTFRALATMSRFLCLSQGGFHDETRALVLAFFRSS